MRSYSSQCPSLLLHWYDNINVLCTFKVGVSQYIYIHYVCILISQSLESFATIALILRKFKQTVYRFCQWVFALIFNFVIVVSLMTCTRIKVNALIFFHHQSYEAVEASLTTTQHNASKMPNAIFNQ